MGVTDQKTLREGEFGIKIAFFSDQMKVFFLQGRDSINSKIGNYHPPWLKSII